MIGQSNYSQTFTSIYCVTLENLITLFLAECIFINMLALSTLELDGTRLLIDGLELIDYLQKAYELQTEQNITEKGAFSSNTQQLIICKNSEIHLESIRRTSEHLIPGEHADVVFMRCLVCSEQITNKGSVSTTDLSCTSEVHFMRIERPMARDDLVGWSWILPQFGNHQHVTHLSSVGEDYCLYEEIDRDAKDFNSRQRQHLVHLYRHSVFFDWHQYAKALALRRW